MTKFVDQPFLAVATGVVFATLSGIASAQSVSPSSSPTSSSEVGLNDTVATQIISATTLQQMLTISNAIGARSGALQAPPGARADAGQRFGMAAGNAAKWNVWGALSSDDNKYDGGTRGANVKFSADALNTVLGADYALAPTLVLGLSAAFDRVDGSSSVNGLNAGNYNTDGYTLAPYLGWQINKDWSLDATVGWGDSDFTGTGNVTNNADRFFYGTNLTYTHWYGNWQVTGKGSYLYGEEKYGNTNFNGTTVANTATKNKVDQWRLGVQAAYWMNGVMPYAGLAYSTDGRSTTMLPGAVQATDDLGKSAWLWSLGVNFISIKNSLTGGIAYSAESGRSHGKRDVLMANINYRF